MSTENAAGPDRQIILDALREASAYAMANDERAARFLAGESDFTFEELDLDSLARMELCIAIEVATGVSIAPDELTAIQTLNGLVERVRAG